MTLAYMTLGWIAGLLLVNWKPSTGTIAPFLIVSGFGLAILMRQSNAARTFVLCLLASGLGIWRFNTVQPTTTEADLAAYNDKGFAEIIGVVIDAPDVRDNDIRLKVEISQIQQDGQTHLVHGLALVNAARFSGYRYGDKLLIQGKPITPPEFDTFSYRDYLARSGIYTTIPSSKITLESHGQGNSMLAVMFDIRDRSRQLISQLLPSPQSALLAGILLGNDNDIPQEVRDEFNATGTSHIVAISGSNITIIAGLLAALTVPLRNKRLVVVLIIAGIAVYTIFVGASPSVVRAAIMGTLAVIAQRVGRKGDGLTALAISVWIMTAINPYWLFDLGLILSAAATLGLILYARPMENATKSLAAQMFGEDTARRIVAVISDAVLITLAAQITTLPIIFLVFGRFSLVSFLVNILIVPAQASIMALGILMLVIGAVWLPLGQLFAWLVGLPVAYTLAIIHAMAQWPGASVPVVPDPGIIALYYILLFGATIVLSQPPETRQTLRTHIGKIITFPIVGLVGVAIAVLLWAMVISRPDGNLHVWFLAVGEGNAVLIQSPQGAHILIDGGENPTKLRAALGSLLPFYKRDIDMLILTQSADKTISAIPPLFERYSIRAVMNNGQEVAGGAYDTLKTILEKQHVPVAKVQSGYILQTNDGMSLEVFMPTIAATSNGKPADTAMALRLTYGDASFVLTSNVSEKWAKTALTERALKPATALQLASNGGEKENPPELVKVVNPQVVLLEAESGNQFAQPDDSVLQGLGTLPLFRTDQQGTIEIATDGKQLWISPGR